MENIYLQDRNYTKINFNLLNNKTQGFTLVELLVVISILAILSLIGFVVFTGVQKSANDTKRKADVEAIAKAYELKFAGVYSALTAEDFTGGKIPEDSSKGPYFNFLAADGSGFKVCAALEDNPNDFCNTPAKNCFCKFSSQGSINTASSDPSTQDTTFGAGLGGVAASSCDPDGILNNNLAGHWHMDDSAGSSRVDSSGMGNTLTSATSIGQDTTGKFPVSSPKSASFNSQVLRSNSSSLQSGGGDHTVTAWVKVNSPLNRYGIVSRDSGTSGSREFHLMYDSTAPGGGRFRYMLFNQGGNASADLYANSFGAANAGSWYFVAARYDATNNRTYLTVNNKTDSRSTVIGGVVYKPSNTGTEFRIGWRSFGADLNGSVDEVRFYTRFLSDSEINLLYNNGDGCI